MRCKLRQPLKKRAFDLGFCPLSLSSLTLLPLPPKQFSFSSLAFPSSLFRKKKVVVNDMCEFMLDVAADPSLEFSDPGSEVYLILYIMLRVIRYQNTYNDADVYIIAY